MKSLARTRLALLALVCSVSGAWAQANLTKAEQIYAELATLSPEVRAERILEGAKKEGKFRYINSLRSATGARMQAAIQKKYPFLKAELTELGSQDAAERLVAEEATGRHLTDVVIAAISDLTEVQSRNLPAAYPTPVISRIGKQYENFIDPKHRLLPLEGNEHGIVYNPNLVKVPPKSYEDLCDARFKGTTSFDPLEVRFLVGLYKIFDEDLSRVDKFIKCLSENEPIIQRGHLQRHQLMIAGDHGISPDQYLNAGYADLKKNPKTPFAVVYEAPIAVAALVSLINKNAEYPYAAALFSDWTLSDECQTILFEEFRGPVVGKHPYYPDNAKLVAYGSVPADIENKLVQIWKKYMRDK